MSSTIIGIRVLYNCNKELKGNGRSGFSFPSFKSNRLRTYGTAVSIILLGSGEANETLLLVVFEKSETGLITGFSSIIVIAAGFFGYVEAVYTL